jgi:hypothetical protein
MGLLLIAAPQRAAAQGIADGLTALAPSVAPTTPPTAAGEVGITNGAVEEVDEVVVDVLVAGASEEQAKAIANLIKFLQQNKVSNNGVKANATAEWDHKHSHTEEEKKKGRRALRATGKAIAPKADDADDAEEINENVNSTRCTAVFNGTGNYSVVHITLHGNASKVR